MIEASLVLKIFSNFFFFTLDKTGLVKADAFFTILALHGMNLTDQDKTRLTKKYAKANKMNWKDAL